MNEPTPRQVLYGLVGAGLVLLVVVLTIGGAAAGVVPPWWSAMMAVGIAAGSWWIVANWRRTFPILLIAIGLLVVWMVGTLMVTD